MTALLLIAISYLAGSIPTGVLIVRSIRPGLDLRQVGSGNIGATNVARALGTGWGVATMIGDCLKGLVPVLIARFWSVAPIVLACVAIAAFIGHIYPIYLKFRGGKGVATALGILLGISPMAACLAAIIWTGASVIARSTAAGALSAAIALPIIMIGVIDKAPGIFLALSLIVSAMIFYTHRTNIRQILRKE